MKNVTKPGRETATRDDGRGLDKTPRLNLIVVVLALTGIAAASMQTLVIPLIGILPEILSTTADTASWVLTATLLAAAVATPIAGRLGDMFGKKRMMLFSVMPLVLGSAVCAIADSVIPMVFGRGLQGLGMGVVPLGISLLRDVVPKERLGGAVAFMSASMGVGGALGLPFAAAVDQYLGWRPMFWIMAAVAAVVLVAIWRVVPGDTQLQVRGAHFDGIGAVTLSAGLVALLIAISKGNEWGWGSLATVVALCVAAASLGIWAWWEHRAPQPLVDLRIARRPKVLVTNIAAVLVGFALYAQSIVLPQVLQLPTITGYGLGQTMISMGLWMAPAGLVMMAISPVGAMISAKYGAKITLATGAGIIAISYAAFLALSSSTWGILAVAVVCNMGVGLAYGAMPTLVMQAVPVTETASANSVNTLMRSLGTSMAAAVAGALVANSTVDIGGLAFPAEDGFNTAMMLGCAVSILAALVALVIPRAGFGAGGGRLNGQHRPGADSARAVEYSEAGEHELVQVS